MKNEKNYVGFSIPKVWQILKHFSGTFHQLLISEECMLVGTIQKVFLV